MTLDVRTIFVVTMLVCVAAVLAMYLLYMGHRQERALKHAAVALTMQCLGLSLLALRGLQADWLSIVAANGLIVTGLAYMLGSVRMFYGREFRPRILIPVAVVTLVVFGFFTYVSPDYPSRVIAYSLLAGSVAFLGVREFLHDVDDEIWSGPRILVAILLGAYGVALLARALLVWTQGTSELMAPTAGNLAVYVLGSLIPGFWPYLMALLVGQRLLAQQRRLASTDALTSILNRRGFEASAEREFSRFQRKGEPLSLLLLDIDHFKRINDTYGHQTGDGVLVLLAAQLGKALRTEDVFGRLGGEEFAIILPSIGHPQALEVAERLRASVAAMPLDTPGREDRVTISIGVASTGVDGNGWEGIYQVADQRLYEAKHAGRDRVRGRGEVEASPGTDRVDAVAG